MTDVFDAVGLEAILVGNGGAQLHGAPVITEDLDYLVRDTPPNRRKFAEVARKLGPDVRVRPISELTEAVRLEGIEPPVDLIFGLGGNLKFESVRSRAQKLSPGGGRVWLAALADIIKAKEAANRPKDLAALVILRYTADTKKVFGEAIRGDEPPKAAERVTRYRTRKPGSNRTAKTRRRRG